MGKLLTCLNPLNYFSCQSMPARIGIKSGGRVFGTSSLPSVVDLRMSMSRSKSAQSRSNPVKKGYSVSYRCGIFHERLGSDRFEVFNAGVIPKGQVARGSSSSRWAVPRPVWDACSAGIGRHSGRMAGRLGENVGPAGVPLFHPFAAALMSGVIEGARRDSR